MKKFKGWLLDCYPSLLVPLDQKREPGMTFWIKTERGENIKLRDLTWKAKIYASGSACDDPEFVFSKLRASDLVSSVEVVKKRVSVSDWKRSNALEIKLRQADKGKKVADILESTFRNPSAFRLYNVDVSPEQQYFLEKDLFPLARVEVVTNNGEEITNWHLLDSVEETDYEIPKLRVTGLDVKLGSKVPRMDSRLESITLTNSVYPSGDESQVETITIESKNDESQILIDTARQVKEFDPDFIITGNGDAFVFPYLYSKDQRYQTSFDLNRDPDAFRRVSYNTKSGGRTYFSYGRIMYRPTTQRFYGRIHVDGQNTFVYDQCRFEGLFEIARISRMPFHVSSRASIGKSLSGLQFYCAYLRDTLIPYKPVTSEDIKTMDELLVADRGGLVFVPLPGIHENVCEFDFASLYPSIIKYRNISAETVNCNCCPDSDNRLTDLCNLHICKRKLGIVPESLGLPLSKRIEYKILRDQVSNPRLKQAYNERAGALKWILVTCLARESLVLIKQNNLIRYVGIGDLIDRILGDDEEGIVDARTEISVAGVGHDFKSKFSKVQKFLKIPNKQKLFKITMDDGKSITTTPDHPFYLLENGKLEVREASKLKVGTFVPVAKKLCSFFPVRDINVVDTKKHVVHGDLGFARIRKIEELDRIDEYVYCFQLADYELPGFFAGEEGAIFTHNCFGYLSYRNAKFMKIDAHIAVCSVARQTLLDAAHTAENRGYRVIHAIVDSLWVSKERASDNDYKGLRDEIEKVTKFKLAMEGVYKWIVFLPSKVDSQNQVPNRYFGAFERNNELKVRGIEWRRRDAPLYFKACQEKMLKELAKCDNVEELRRCARSDCMAIFNEFATRLERHDAPPLSLLITRRLSKNLSEYNSKRQLSVNAALRLEEKGLQLKAGQSVSYVITRYKTQGMNRTLPEELASEAEYDSNRYVELLADCCATILSPFGVDKKMLQSRTSSLLAWT